MRKRELEGGKTPRSLAWGLFAAGLATAGLGGGCYTGHQQVPGGGGDDDAASSDAGESAGDDADPWEPEVGDCDPGAVRRSTLRRLNQREYRNTVRDLLGIEQLPAFTLPIDALSSKGLDNDGDALTLDLAGAERYYDAALAVSASLGSAQERPLESCAGLTGAALQGCLEPGLEAWLSRAFRRPAPADAVALLGELVEGAQTYDEAAEGIALFTLTSPHFLFHYKAPEDGDGGVADPYELAGRLSYLLWSSMPDEELVEAAADGVLAQREGLEDQVERMLADDRAERFFADFSSVWLALDSLDAKPDAQVMPELFADMRTETRLYFEDLGREGRPVNDLLRSDQSWVNGRLAAHYGLETSLADDQWEQVTLPADQRAGILTQASVLTASAGAEFSDPIRRGAWIAEALACEHPPPPPFEPPALPEPNDGEEETIREVLERHTSDPVCAGCHMLMDPYGIALESYDRTGAFRTEYEDGLPIDASGSLLSGEQFDDAVELGAIMADGGEFEACVGSYLSAYGMGRALSNDEQCFVELAFEQARADSDELSFDQMLVALITSYLFATQGASS